MKMNNNNHQKAEEVLLFFSSFFLSQSWQACLANKLRAAA